MVRLSLTSLAAAALLLSSLSAQARPDEETTTIGLLLGPRYVPHGHFEEEAAGSGTPVTSSTPWNGMGMLSFGYNPYVYLHVSLEVGYGFDSFTLQTAKATATTSAASTTIGITSVPIVASVRITPWGGSLYPYFGGGGGYMLNFFSGVPSGEEENHTYSGHFMAGVAYEITKQWTVYAEDRFAISTPDIVPIGELQTGGNMILVGVNFVFAPIPDLAPHDKIQM